MGAETFEKSWGEEYGKTMKAYYEGLLDWMKSVKGQPEEIDDLPEDIVSKVFDKPADPPKEVQ